MNKKIVDLMTDKFDKVCEDDPIYEAIKKIASNREISIACVVDREDRLTGILTPKHVLEMVEIREYGAVRGKFFAGPGILHLMTSKYAKHIMSAPVHVLADDKIEKAIDIMIDDGFYEIPVVDKNMKIIGAINYFDIIISCVECLK